MDYKYKFYFNFIQTVYGTFDPTTEVLADNNYIIKPSIEKVKRFHKDLEPNSNTLKFQMVKNATLGDKTIMEWLLLSSNDIHIKVTRAIVSQDGTIGTYFNYFIGFLSDNYKIVISNGGIELIDFQGEDYTNKVLKRKRIANITYSGIQKYNYIHNTSDIPNSLLHKIANSDYWDVVYTGTNMNSPEISGYCPNITNRIPAYFLPYDSDATKYDLIKSLLYEYGYTFYFNDYGKLVVKSFRIPADVNPEYGFFNTTSTSYWKQKNIYGKIEISRILPKYSYVRVNLNTVKTVNNAVIFSDTTGGDSINKCNIVLSSGKAYPKGSEDLNGEEEVHQNTYAEYKLESGEEIIAVDGIRLDIVKDSQITLVRSDNYGDKVNLKLINDGSSDYTIRKLDIIGNTVYCKDQIIAETYDKGASNRTLGTSNLTYDTKYISNSAEGYYLAETLGSFYKYANVSYTLKSDWLYGEIGDNIRILDDIVSGIDTIAQIVEKKEYADTDLITYVCIGIAPITVTNPIKEEYVKTSTPVNTVTQIGLFNAIKAVERKNILYNFNSSIIIPIDIYPTGGSSQSDFAEIIEASSNYRDVNFFVVLKSVSDNADYEDVIRSMRNAGISVLVYLNTDFTMTPLDTIKTNINTIISNNPNIDGLFIDRIPVESTVSTNTKNYYGEVRTFAKNAGLYPLVMNVDEFVSQEYYDLEIGDIFVVGNKEAYPTESDLIDYVNVTNPNQYNKAILTSKCPLDDTAIRMLLKYSKVIYHTDYGNTHDKSLSVNMIQKSYIRLTAGKYNIYDNTPSRKTIRSDMIARPIIGFNLTVKPNKFDYWGTLTGTLVYQLKTMAGVSTYVEVEAAAAAASPRVPLVTSTEFVSTAELSWEYQTDLGPALKYYEILVSKDHDPENSDPENGTWYKPRNDGVDWCFTGDTVPLQLTIEFYTFKAPLELDEDDNSIESIYFFKVRRVSITNSDWGYSAATLRPLNSVEIGKDTILAPHIRAGSITTDKIAVNAITAAHIYSVDGGSIRTGNIASETYVPNSAGWKLALSGSAEFNDVIVRGTVYATDGTFSGSINSGPLMLNKNAPSTTLTTITSGDNVVTWVRALQTSTGITAGSFNSAGTYNSTALGRLEMATTSEVITYEQWQQTGTHMVTTTYWNPYAHWTNPNVWYDSYGIPHYTAGYFTPASVTATVAVEDDVKWSRAATKYIYHLSLYSTTNALLCTYTDWYETAGTWVNTGITNVSLNASTSAPSAASATQGTVTFTESGSVSLTSGAYTYRLVNLPSGYDANYPTGTVFMTADTAGSGGFLRIKQ